VCVRVCLDFVFFGFFLCVSCDHFVPVLLALVLLALVSSVQYYAERLAEKNVCEMTYSVSSKM